MTTEPSADPPDPTVPLRQALQSLLATPWESPDYHRRRRLARRLLDQHPELGQPLDLRGWAQRERERHGA